MSPVCKCVLAVGRPSATMKLIVASVLILCCAYVQSRELVIFRPGADYRFSQIACTITEVPDVSELRKAGTCMKFHLFFQPRINYVVVTIANPKVVDYEEEIPEIDLENLTFRFKPFDEEYEKFLIQPFNVTYKNGVIVGFYSTVDEPQIVTNLKKGVLNAFNLSPRLLGQGPKIPADGDVVVRRAMEQGVKGICESQYVVQPYPWAGNPEADVLNITKTRDYENCRLEANWTRSSYPPNNCSECEAEEMTPLNTITVSNYDTYVESDKFVVIERIFVESYTVYQPLTADAHTISFNASKLVTLLDQVPPPPIPFAIKDVKFHNLLYVFPRDIPVYKEIEDPKTRPAPFRPNIRQSPLDEVERLIEEIVLDIEKNDEKPMNATPLKVLEASRGIRLMTYEDIQKLYDKSVGQDRTIKGLVTIQVIALCGLPHCQYLILDKIQARQMGKVEAAEILSRLPLYCYTPTFPLMKKYAEVCKSIKPTSTKLLRSCWLGYASMVDKACGSNTTTVPTIPGLPTYCDETQEMELVEVVKKQLGHPETTDEYITYVYTLALLHSPYAIDILDPLTKGQSLTGSSIIHEMVRVIAIYALGESVDDEDDERDIQRVIDLVGPLFFNSTETLIVRATALNVLMETALDEHIYEKIASITWTEDDSQIISLIITGLTSIANSTNPCFTERAAHASHALNVLYASQDENNRIGIQDSYRNIIDDFIDKFDIGSFIDFRTTISNSSYIPNRVTYSLKRILSGFLQIPREVILQLQGIESVVIRLLGIKTAFKSYSLSDIIKPTYDNDEPYDYHGLFKKLRILPLYDQPYLLSALFTTSTYVNGLHYFDDETLLRNITDVINKNHPIFKEGLVIDYQNITNLGIVQHQEPSILGIPFLVEIKAPKMTNFRGIIKADFDKRGTEKNMESLKINNITLKSDLHLTVSTVLLTTVSTLNPFTKQEPAIGVTSSLYVSIPFAVKAKVKLNERMPPYKEEGLRIRPVELEYKIKLLQNFSGMPSRTLLFKDEVKPFSYNRTYDHIVWKPVMIHPIIIKPTQYNINCTKFLGIPCNFTITSDRFWQDKSSFWSHLKQMSLFTHFTTPNVTPNFKFVDYELVVDTKVAKNTNIYGTIFIEHNGSEIHKKLLKGKFTQRDFVGYWLGYSKIPWRCDHENPSLTTMKKMSKTSGISSSKHDLTPENSRTRYALHIKTYITGSNRDQLLNATFAWKRSPLDLTNSLRLEIISDKLFFAPDEKLNTTITGKLQYPEVPCRFEDVIRPTLVTPVTPTYGHLELILNSNIRPEKRITGDVTFFKSEGKIEYEKSDANWLIKQCRDDMNQGKVLSDICEDAVQFVSEYNMMDLKIKYPNDLPLRFLNYSYKVDRYVKYLLYDQLWVRPSKPGERPSNELNVTVGFNYDGPGINITLIKPYERVNFNDTYLPFYDFIYPLNARVSTKQMFIQDITAKATPVTCHLMNGFIETFDNATYPYKLTDCNHVLTKDCSPSDVFSVLVKKHNEKQNVLTLYLLEHTVFMVPPEEGSNDRKYKVIIDGGNPEPVDRKQILIITKTNDSNGIQKVLVHISYVEDYLLIQSDVLFLKIQYNGNTTRILVSNQYRGSLCGMCSNADRNRGSTLIGPDQCEYIDPKDMVLSYAVREPNCHVPPPSDNKICPYDDVINGTLPERRRRMPDTSPYARPPFQRRAPMRDDWGDLFL